MKQSGHIIEHRRLVNFWNRRYQKFTLNESGINSPDTKFVQLLYACKKEAYLKSLNPAGFNRESQGKILDVGCGQGYFASLCQQLYPKMSYWGLDISKKVIQHNQRLFPKYRWLHTDFCQPKFTLSAKFDLIQSIETLHLIIDDDYLTTGLKNLQTLLKPYGYLLISDVLPKDRLTTKKYIVFHPLNFYLSRLRLKLLSVTPMYYFFAARRVNLPLAKQLLPFIPAEILYCSDRLLLRANFPQIRPYPDSAMKLLLFQRIK